MDPGLLHIFVYLAPEAELLALCERVSPCLTASLLVLMANSESLNVANNVT